MGRLNIAKRAALVCAAAGWLSVVAKANATLTWDPPITLNSPNIIGISIGVTGAGQGNLTFEQTVAQHLLDMSANSTETDQVGNFTYKTSTLEYSGTITPGVFLQPSGGGSKAYTVPSGYDLVIAKYDGQSAGYVLFYLGQQDAILPEFSYSIWGTDAGQYQISGFSAFNAPGITPGITPVPEPTTVIAGAMLLLPFAASTLRMLRKNRG